MTPEQSRRVNELFHQARELDRPQRGAFLEKGCSDDPVVRAEVERLLGQETANHLLIRVRSAVVDVLGTEPTRSLPGQPTGDLATPIGPPAPDQVLAGQLISHYLVEERLGAGGMGEVYLARDRALGRLVALKVLRPGFTRSVRDRLLWEASASARLQHPGIATFYEAGQAEGVDFIAMEFVRGETLRDHLRAGPLAPAQALGLVVEVLEALVHAHFSGIMHRDIKPENIMITPDGSAKLLDMGLAKGLLMETEKEFRQAAGTSVTREPAHEARSHLFAERRPPQADEPSRLEGLGGLTQAGAVVGTLGYMPPEQLRGERVDVRADIFAVGAVLYEMIKGRPAFPGASPNERITSMLHRDPDPIEGPDIPPELNSVLARALAADPSHRYPSATVFLNELRRIAGRNVRIARSVGLAPLDFHNVSDDESNTWIASALPEALASGLARVPGFTILPREKVLMAAAPAGSSEEAWSPVAIGRRLGCSMVLSGSYRPAESGLNVTARVTEVATGEVIFEHTLRESLEQIFNLPDRFAGAVAASLDLELPQSVNRRPDVEVCECHARARHLLVGASRGAFEQARDLLERAVSIDPGYAPALATLAQLHAMQHNFSTDPRMLETAAEYARRAIEADPLLGEAHLWNGYVLGAQGKHLEADRAWRRTIELDPSNFPALYFAAAHLLYACSRSEAVKLLEASERPPGTKDPHLCRRREAARLLQRALELNPMFCWAWLALGCSHLDLGNFGEARWCLTKAVELEPRAVPPTAGVAGYLGECLRRCGELTAARSQFLTGLRALEETDHMYRDTWRGFFLCGLGRTALEQGDLDAARAAYTQAALHLRGRPRARCGGHVLVQALAGLTRSGEGPQPFEEATHLFEQREGFDFGQLWYCDEDVGLLELSRAASTLDRIQLARELLERACDLGSAEALIESGTSLQSACRNFPTG